MRCPETIQDEQGRLSALADYGLGTGVNVPSLSSVVEIAAKLFGAPAAAVNMIGDDHVFFAASTGIGDCDMRRDISFCAHAITQDDVMVVEDAALDPRFYDNPLVTGGQIRFYAGVPLVAQSGHALGALCIIDSNPRVDFSRPDRARLKDLAQIAMDKLERRRLEWALKAGPPPADQMGIGNSQAFISIDQQCRITNWNAAASKLFGYSPAEIKRRPLDLLCSNSERDELHSAIETMLERGAIADGEICAFTAVRKDGSCFPAEFSWSQWVVDGQTHFGLIVNDMTVHQSPGDTLYRLTNYDSLTNLPNRNLLYSRTATVLEGGNLASLVLFDVDGLKDVNGTLGNATGDRVLQEIAQRMLDCVQGRGLVSRIAGDEFAILLPDISDPTHVNGLANRVAAAVARPILAEGEEVRVAASCGMAIAPLHGDTAELLIGSAELALRQAKTGRPARTVLFVPALRSEAAARRLFEAELYRAFERDQFSLHYQPQIRLADGALAGAEALLRWRHPLRQLLQPAAFLPALERSPLAAEVGSWIIDRACAQTAEWRKMQSDFRMSVNLFSAQFQAKDLPSQVASALSRHSLAPDALELEITENIVLDHESTVLPQLLEIREQGVRLAFDDFGTGYASLNLLRKYPISHIKIDKGFMPALLEADRDQAIVTSVIDMCYRLGLEVIAEGVENAAQLDFLRQYGCHEGQGYLFGKPVPGDLFAEKYGLVNFAEAGYGRLSSIGR